MTKSEARCRELLPCPFCGNAPILQNIGSYRNKKEIDSFIVSCSCPAQDKCFFYKEDAINAWNNRAHHAPQPDLQKIIGQMESMKEDDTGNAMLKSYHAGIDRCIALVKAEME